jgi:hypothetical protein
MSCVSTDDVGVGVGVDVGVGVGVGVGVDVDVDVAVSVTVSSALPVLPEHPTKPALRATASLLSTRRRITLTLCEQDYFSFFRIRASNE